jgi:2-hydroxychromene-2-carboxylate isomerase
MSDPGPRFFFGAMSPYAWLSAERIDRVLPQARWRPLLLGAVFKVHGRVSWGMTAERAAGQAECQARAAGYGLGPIRWPDPWPTDDLLVARAMTYADMRGELKPFALTAMRLSFLEGADLAEPDTIREAARRTGIEPDEMQAAVADQTVKDRLRAVTDEALAAGVFGVPTVAVHGEVFWGDDRLEEAAAATRG